MKQVPELKMRGTDAQVKIALGIKHDLINAITMEIDKCQLLADEIKELYKNDSELQDTIATYQKKAAHEREEGCKAIYGLGKVDEAKWFIHWQYLIGPFKSINIGEVRYELDLAGYFRLDEEVPAEYRDEDKGGREYDTIWDVIECLYSVLGVCVPEFDVYAIAQELIYYKDGRLFADLQREDFWEIVERHDLSGTMAGFERDWDPDHDRTA